MDDVIKRKRRPSLRSISQNARTFLIVGPLKELTAVGRRTRENKIIWFIIYYACEHSNRVFQRTFLVDYLLQIIFMFQLLHFMLMTELEKIQINFIFNIIYCM